MDFQIKIAKIGENKGTVGWLAKLIEAGATFKEGYTKKGNRHGLWLKWHEGDEEKSQFLASFNVNGSDDGNFNDSYRAKYATANQMWEGDAYRANFWTDAAWDTLMDAAETWCMYYNNIRNNDECKDVVVKIV